MQTDRSLSVLKGNFVNVRKTHFTTILKTEIRRLRFLKVNWPEQQSSNIQKTSGNTVSKVFKMSQILPRR